MGQESQRPARGVPGKGSGPQLEESRTSRSRLLRSWLILGTSLMLALALYYGLLGSSWVEHLGAWTADWTSRGLNLLGASTRAEGTVLSSASFAVNIVAECTAVGPLMLFIGAVAAYPSPLKAKTMGVVLGLVVLSGANLVRVMSLFWIGSAYPQYLDVAHLLVWQTAIILLAIVLWLFWADRIAYARDR